MFALEWIGTSTVYLGWEWGVATPVFINDSQFYVARIYHIWVGCKRTHTCVRYNQRRQVFCKLKTWQTCFWSFFFCVFWLGLPLLLLWQTCGKDKGGSGLGDMFCCFPVDRNKRQPVTLSSTPCHTAPSPCLVTTTMAAPRGPGQLLSTHKHSGWVCVCVGCQL